MTARTDRLRDLVRDVQDIPPAEAKLILARLCLTAPGAVEAELMFRDETTSAGPAVSECCRAAHAAGYVCTLPGGHGGDHKAVDSTGMLVCTWGAWPPLGTVPDHAPEQDAADWQRPAAEEQHAAPVPLRAVPPPEQPSALIPCAPAVGGERTCDNWCGNFCCTGSAIHAGLAHASHAENGDVIGVWPAVPQVPMGHLASLADRLAERVTPGAGGPR